MKRIIFTILFSLLLITSTTFAATLPINGDAIFTKANSIEGITATGLIQDIDEGIGEGGLVSLLTILKSIGLTVAVCVLPYMAVQIILAPPERKAQLKDGITPYLLGLLLLIYLLMFLLKIKGVILWKRF